MPALLERPKMTKTMAVALHRHIMRERERKRQEEEEADKIMEQKMKEEQQRRRKKEEEERMSLEETREQIAKLEEKLQALQDEKHQLFLQLKKVLNEEDKRRAKIKEQNELAALSQQPYPASMTVHPGSHLIMHGSHISPSRAHGLLGDRPKNQLYSHTTIPGRAYPSQTTFTSSQPEHAHFQTSQSGHSSYASSQSQHSVPYTGGQAVPATYPAGSQPIRGASAFQSYPPYVSHQQTGYTVHTQFPPQQGVRWAGYLAPATSMPLQKQLEHANQQSGFSDSASLRSLHPQSMHAGQTLLQPTQLQVSLPSAKSGMIYPHQTRPTSPGAFQHSGTPPQPSHSAGVWCAVPRSLRRHFIQHSQTHRYYNK
uniref:G protein pathway suppressor 2 n=1 Tax=Petromyzon marinus TaxID=7757 RepID=S4RIZ0_PETMA